MYSEHSFLLIDSATSVLRLGLYHEGKLHKKVHEFSPRHGEVILDLIEQLNAEAGSDSRAFDYLCWNRGPGSFTGIRLALSVVQALALTSGSKVLALSSLELLACQAYRSYGYEKLTCLIDARMQKVYKGVFDVSDVSSIAVADEEIIGLDDLSFISNDRAVAAIGMNAVADILPIGKHKKSALDMSVDLETMLLLALRYLQQGRATHVSHTRAVYLYDYSAS